MKYVQRPYKSSLEIKCAFIQVGITDKGDTLRDSLQCQINSHHLIYSLFHRWPP